MAERTTIRWSAASAAWTTATVLAVYGLARGLIAARLPLLLGFLSAVLAAMLCLPIDWLARRLPRWVAVLITLVGFLGLAFGLGWWLAPIIRDQIDKLPAALASARARAQEFWWHHVGTSAAPTADASQAISKAAPIAYGALQSVAAAVFVVVLAFFFAANRDRLRSGARRLVPLAHRAVFDQWSLRVGRSLRQWTGGILVSMTLMGLVTGFGLWIVGVSSPLLLGVVTFLGTFIPYVGAIASALPGLAIALSQSPRHFLYALAVYVVVHHVEGYLVQPFVMRRAVELKPAWLLLWEAVLGAVFGLPGLVVATPLLACVKVSVDYLWIERRLVAGENGDSTPA